MDKEHHLTMYETKDYNKFSYLPFNRNVVPRHVEKLKGKFKGNNKQAKAPITVNSNFEIIDGQHRYNAIKDLKQPLFFMVDDEFRDFDIVDKNANQQGWLAQDYLKFFSEKGYEDYQKLEQLCIDTGLSVSILLDWIAGQAYYLQKRFKEGEFKFNFTEQDQENYKIAMDIIDMWGRQGHATSRYRRCARLHRALRKFLATDGLDKQSFINNMEKHITPPPP